MTKVKICGITNLEDALAAVDAGADLLGFNFYRPSARYVEPEKAKQITEELKRARDNSPTMVGVFVEEPLGSLVETVNQVELDGIQLHGNESPEFCASLRSLTAGTTIIKALRVNNQFDPNIASSFPVDAIMLDAFHPELRGGTGRTIDWSVARATRHLVNQFFLSGGLTPANVAQAIASVEPFAVDACSSLESLPGRKDERLMKEFVSAVRNG